jgi:hypothetical protein
LNLADTFRAIAFTVGGVSPKREPDDGGFDEATVRLCRQVAEETVGRYARERGKRRWCEKSLSTFALADQIAGVFPHAQFVTLFRQPLDTIASLLEASPWGYSAFGIEPYVRMHPENLIFALAKYWIDRTEALLRFEEEHPEVCTRLRYEDMVTDPVTTFQALFTFLGLQWDPAYISAERVFEAGRKQSLSFGDFKILYTDKIETTSVGRGWTVPSRHMLPPPMQEHIDHLNGRLRYEPIADLGARVPEATRDEVVPNRAEDLDRFVLEAVRRRVAALVSSAPYVPDQPVELLCRDRNQSWVIDFAHGSVRVSDSADRSKSWTVLTESDTLRAVSNGAMNAPVAIRRGLFQVFDDQGELIIDDKGHRILQALLRVINLTDEPALV